MTNKIFSLKKSPSYCYKTKIKKNKREHSCGLGNKINNKLKLVF